MRCETCNNYSRTYYVVRIFVKGSLEYRETIKTDRDTAISTATLYTMKGHKVQILKIVETTEL